MRFLAPLLLLSLAWSADEAPKPPDYAAELVKLSEKWIACEASKDDAERKQRPTFERMEAARKDALTAFASRANLKPVTMPELVALRGKDAAANGGLELRSVNLFIENVRKGDFDSACSDGYGVSLYAVYRNAPWALNLCRDFTPQEAKRQGDEMAKMKAAKKDQ